MEAAVHRQLGAVGETSRSSRRRARRGRSVVRGRRRTRHVRPVRSPLPARRCRRRRRRRAACCAARSRRAGRAAAGWLTRRGSIIAARPPGRCARCCAASPASVSLCTSVKPAGAAAGSGSPRPRRTSFTLRHRCRYRCCHRSARQPDRDDDARSTPRSRSPCATRESRTEYSCTASVAPGRSSVRNAAQLGVRVGEVAQQVGGEDAVERAVDAGVGEVLDPAVHEAHRRRPATWRRPRPACPPRRRRRRSRRAGAASAVRRSMRPCRSRRRAAVVPGRRCGIRIRRAEIRRWSW